MELIIIYKYAQNWHRFDKSTIWQINNYIGKFIETAIHRLCIEYKLVRYSSFEYFLKYILPIPEFRFIHIASVACECYETKRKKEKRILFLRIITLPYKSQSLNYLRIIVTVVVSLE